MPQPGELIRLDPSTRDLLGKSLVRLIDEAESAPKTYVDDQQDWWDWYNAKPLSRVRSEPWPRASNVVVPVIRTAADAITARLHNRLHTPKRTWSITAKNSQLKNVVKVMEEFLNHESRHTFDIQRATKDWLMEMVIVGRSVMAVLWSEQRGFRFRPGRRGVRAQEVVLHRGPVVEHVPQECILWQKDRTIQESEFVIRKKLMTWGELVNAGLTDGWDQEQIAEVVGSTTMVDEVLASKRESFGVSSGDNEPHDVREVWVRWPLAQLMTRNAGQQGLELQGAEDPAIPVVVTMHRQTGRIFRVVAHPYFFPEWPFLDIYFRKIAGQGYSYGIAKLLEHIQRAITTMTNQTIDASTLSNSIKLLTQSPRMKNIQFVPGQPLFVERIDDVAPINIGTQVVPDINLINLLQAMGERVTGIADPMLGREVRLGGHPSPATNTLVQLQEANKLFDMTLREVRQQLSMAGQMILALYQQSDLEEDVGRLATELGPEDAAVVAELLVGGQDLKFDILALSETVNPEAERNNAVLVSQMTTNYYAFVLRMLPIMENPQAPPAMRFGAQKAVEAASESLIRVLETMEVDDPEDFAINLREAAIVSQQQQIEQFAAQQAAGAGQQGGAGGPAGPVPGGAVGAAPAGANGAETALAGALGSGFNVG